jgi:hypothetical protein
LDDVSSDVTPHLGPLSPDEAGRPAGMLLLVGLAVAILLLLAITIGGAAEPYVRTAAAPACSSTKSVELPAPLSAPAAAGAPVITPDRARVLLAAFWPVREQALSDCDLATLNRIDAGSARDGDVARARCGCLIRSPTTGIDESEVFVPRQTTYPASFVAQVRTEETSGTSWAEAMVFTRAAPAAPWQLSLATGYAADPDKLVVLGSPLTDAEGYAKVPDAATRAAAERAAPALAAFWQESRDSGTVPASSFAPSPWTTSVPARMADHPQDLPQANGLVGHFRYSVDQGDPMVHVLSDGSDLACRAIRTEQTYTAGPDGALPYQSLDRKNWGAELAPGSYRSITLHGVSQTCFLVPPGGRGRVFVLGGDAPAESTATGVPVHRQ